MKRSTDRILTTHAGGLPTPPALARFLASSNEAPPAQLLREATVDVFRSQSEAGVDVVSDGELGRRKIGLTFAYYGPRLEGLAVRPLKQGETSARVQHTNERIEFADFYRDGNDVIAATRPSQRMVCHGFEDPVRLYELRWEQSG